MALQPFLTSMFCLLGDVVGCVSCSSDLLVGDGSTDDCTGGLLSASIGGKNVFFNEIPGRTHVSIHQYINTSILLRYVYK